MTLGYSLKCLDLIFEELKKLSSNKIKIYSYIVGLVLRC